MRKILLLLLCLFASACTGPQVKNAGTVVEREFKDGKLMQESEQRSPYSEYLNKATEQKAAFEMTCPTTGCIILGLKVFHPPGSGGAALQPYTEPETVGQTFVKGVFGLGKDILGASVAVAPWAATVRFMSAFGRLADRPSDSSTHYSSTVNNTDSSNRSTTNTVDTTTNNTTQTTTTTTNSNNTNRNCSTSNASTTGGAANNGC